MIMIIIIIIILGAVEVAGLPLLSSSWRELSLNPALGSSLWTAGPDHNHHDCVDNQSDQDGDHDVHGDDQVHQDQKDRYNDQYDTQIDNRYDDDIHLVDPHLPECEAHALLHVRPQLVLLLQHVARQQGRRWHSVVLLKISENYFAENTQRCIAENIVELFGISWVLAIFHQSGFFWGGAN